MLSDVDNFECENPIKEGKEMERVMLTRQITSSNKVLAVCPLCQKKIHSEDLHLDELNLEKITTFPFSVTFCHHTGPERQNSPKISKKNLHALTIYLDANFAVRGIEPSEFLLFD